METLPLIAALAGGLGTLLGAVALFVQQRGQSTSTRLELAWEITEHELEALRARETALTEERDECLSESHHLREALYDCRRQLKVQGGGQ